MFASRTKAYLFFIVTSILGFIWVGLEQKGYNKNGFLANICLFKKATGFPCPSCGTTRSVVYIINGEYESAFQYNPLGYIVLFIMVAAPGWIVFDVIYKKATFLYVFHKTELFLRRRWVAVFCILFVIVNWVWNIYKFK